MEFCLYDPEIGYYRQDSRRIFGPDGDYITSPYTHPVFAACLSSAIASYLDSIDSEGKLHLVELGAGEGVLGARVCEALSNERVGDRLEHTAVDLDRGEIPQGLTGVVFSNEFFDALPVHRVRIRSGRPREIFVVRSGGSFVEEEGDLSNPGIEPYLKKAFPILREGWTYEVNLKMLGFLEKLAERLREGVLLTLDYGYQWPEYDAFPRADGTLMCYRRHLAHSNPYQYIGRQDMTAHISFDVVQQFGTSRGWTNEQLITQREFLEKWGLFRKLPSEVSSLTPEKLRENLALKELLMPGGISDVIKVQVQRVGMD